MQELPSISQHTLQRMRRIQGRLDLLDVQGAPDVVLAPHSPQPHHGVIVFPGSFNPPTLAHIALLKQAQQFGQAHDVSSLYAGISKRIVDKENVERPLLLDRILLLDTILKRRFTSAGILLFNRGLYVEQAQALRTAFPHITRIFFLLGFDKILQIFDPHYYQNRDESLTQLFSLAELLVAPRGEDGEPELEKLLHQPQNECFAHYVHALPFNAQYRNMSSTEVRQGVSGSERAVPQEVRRFMRETLAYAPPLQRKDGTTLDYYGERIKFLQNALKQHIM